MIKSPASSSTLSGRARSHEESGGQGRTQWLGQQEVWGRRSPSLTEVERNSMTEANEELRRAATGSETVRKQSPHSETTLGCSQPVDANENNNRLKTEEEERDKY